jgi:cytochrome bd-type quinol oxidase subunit 2
MMSAHFLAIIWACIAAFTVLAYIVLDGFDLGLGILFFVERGSWTRRPDQHHRSGLGW